MRNDRFHICISFYAVLAFVFAILGQTLLCGLLLGFVIVMEKDEWLTKQVMQGFFLALAEGMINSAVNFVSIFYAVPLLGVAVSGIVGFIHWILTLVLFILALVGINRVSKDTDARIPIAAKLANKAFGLVCTVEYKRVEEAVPQEAGGSGTEAEEMSVKPE